MKKVLRSLWERRGLAGTIVVILVLGYMGAVGVSQSYLVQAEIKGSSLRKDAKKAYYAAFAGISFVLAQLRADSTNTYSSDIKLARYFGRDTDWDLAHYRAFPTTGSVTYAGRCGGTGTNLVESKVYKCVTTFDVNTDTDTSQASFMVCSYPGETDDVYWVKSQGTFRGDWEGADGQVCQLWAEVKIDRSSESVILKRFGQMPAQSLTYESSITAVKDFWDWQAF
jgi:hypothetical protein